MGLNIQGEMAEESYLSPSTLTSTFEPNTTPLATLLHSLLLTPPHSSSLLTSPPPFRPSPTLPPSTLIFTFGPDIIPPLTPPSRSSPHSSPSVPLLPNLHQVTTFHCCPVPCTQTPLIPSLRDSVIVLTSDFDSTLA
ncbi:uncharacterized protein EI90DRAFT_3116197 [Cantharellus anzutake]|uniref:uncharacterized protein n=1 Tax=Cantharellus anzutake TaxID=1750568 RepID=UPI0019062D68|nr:uncharacterized protein EI90DRAFT_3116197 [Cantharellus anzutake]KAF8342267.1 hypothetical protein EI90DRAFT_3116197 [Cantharellus anzutake]